MAIRPPLSYTWAVMEEIPTPPRNGPPPVKKTDLRRGQQTVRPLPPPNSAPDPMEDLLDASRDEGPPKV